MFSVKYGPDKYGHDPVRKIENPADLRALLREETLQVSFLKKSTGEKRTMVVTLEDDYIPESKEPKTGDGSKSGPSDKNEELISVYSIDSKGWRSFYWGNILEIALA